MNADNTRSPDPHSRAAHVAFSLSLVSFPRRTSTAQNERQNHTRAVLRRRVRVPRLAGRTGRRRAGRRRGDQGPAEIHATVREAQRRTSVEQRARVEQPSQVFPQRRTVRPTVQGHEE